MIVVAQILTDEEARELSNIRKICLVGSRARSLASKAREE
jgi:hypothetical protein